MAKRILIYTNHFYPEQFKINEIVDWLAIEDFKVRVITCYPNYPHGKFYKKSTFQSEKYYKVQVNRLFIIPRGNAAMAIPYWISENPQNSLAIYGTGIFIPMVIDMFANVDANASANADAEADGNKWNDVEVLRGNSVLL